MQRSIAAIALAIALLTTACSVSSPRDGTPVAANADAAGDPLLSDGDIDASSAGDAEVAASDSGLTTAAPGEGASPRNATASTGSGAAATPASSDIGSTVGVTSDSITVSVLAPFSGDLGQLFKTFADNAFGLWASEINEHGGIHGRKLVVKQVDNRGTAEGGVGACKEVRTNGSFMAISMSGLGGADVSSADCLDAARIPWLGTSLSGYRDHWRYVVSPTATTQEAEPLASFIKNVIGDGKGKTGIIVVNDPIMLTARDTIRRELARVGVTHVRDETVSPNQGSFVAELSRLRSAGATTVALVTAAEVMGIVRDARAIGYNPNFTGLFWPVDEFSQAAGELFEGIKAIRTFPTSESKAYTDYQAKSDKYGYAVQSTTIMAYYGVALIVSDTMTKVGQALGRDAYMRATRVLGDYDNGILAMTFPRDRLVADTKVFPVVCCNANNTWKGLGASRQAF